MAYLLSGLVALVIALLIARGFTSANPATMARQLRFLGGVLLMAIAAVLALRGRIDFALLLGFAGWGLLMGRGVLPWGSGGWGGSTPSANQGSRVATDHLEMELDHTSGAIRGTISSRGDRAWKCAASRPMGYRLARGESQPLSRGYSPGDRAIAYGLDRVA